MSARDTMTFQAYVTTTVRTCSFNKSIGQESTESVSGNACERRGGALVAALAKCLLLILFL